MKNRVLQAVIFALLTLSVTAVSAQNHHDSFVLGVNRTELHNLKSEEAQMLILDDIKRSGAKSVRLTISRTEYREIVAKQIAHCNEIGLDVMLVLKLGAVKQMYPLTSELRNSEGRFYNVYKHSELDPQRFRQWCFNTVVMYKNRNLKVDVIEVGNEFGWTDFNADLPVKPKGEGVVYDDKYNWDTLPGAVRAGIRQVGYISQITKEVVDEIYGGSPDQPKVILGGMNNFHDTKWMISVGGTLITPQLILKLLNGTLENQPKGADFLATLDGVGVHMYPHEQCAFKDNYEEMVGDAVKYIEKWMAPVIAETSLPMYLTEYGFRTDKFGGASENERIIQFQAFSEALDRTDEKCNWAQAHVFSWDQGMSQLCIGDVPLKCARKIFK